MISNASAANLLILMIVTAPAAPVHERCSMIIVEEGTKAMDIFRDVPTMHDLEPVYGRTENHAEILKWPYLC
jgi:hypothetical protein